MELVNFEHADMPMPYGGPLVHSALLRKVGDSRNGNNGEAFSFLRIGLYDVLHLGLPNTAVRFHTEDGELPSRS